MPRMFAPVEPGHGTGDLVAGGLLLATPLVLAFPILTLWSIALFVSQGADDWWWLRSFSEFLVWQLPLVLWIATLVAVVVLAIKRRRALPTALLGVGLTSASMAAGVIVPFVASVG